MNMVQNIPRKLTDEMGKFKDKIEEVLKMGRYDRAGQANVSDTVLTSSDKKYRREHSD